MKYFPNEKQDIIRLVNITNTDEWTVYIGRQNAQYNVKESSFANPYTVDEFGRETAVRLYTLHFIQKLSERSFYRKFCDLEGETLGCWCIPDICHGEVICNAIVAKHRNQLSEYLSQQFTTTSKTLFGFNEHKDKAKQSLDEIPP